jgi:hypothetical protein
MPDDGHEHVTDAPAQADPTQVQIRLEFPPEWAEERNLGLLTKNFMAVERCATILTWLLIGDPRVGQLVTARMNTAPLLNMLERLAAGLDVLSEEERNETLALVGEVRTLLERRNALIHSSWGEMKPDDADAIRVRLRDSKSGGMMIEEAGDLHAVAKQAFEVAKRFVTFLEKLVSDNEKLTRPAQEMNLRLDTEAVALAVTFTYNPKA